MSRRAGAATPDSSPHKTPSSGKRASRANLIRGPPSSYRDAKSGPDRNALFTPSADPEPTIQYLPNLKDPLDVEVAKTVNGLAHGFLIERVDPALRTRPHAKEELKAQYSISNALGSKVITCRLVVITRSTPKSILSNASESRKVMCRVGGGKRVLRF